MPPFSQIPDAASENGRSKVDTVRRESFRPVALPALAAAVRTGAPATADTRQAPRRPGILGLVHEDAPLV